MRPGYGLRDACLLPVALVLRQGGLLVSRELPGRARLMRLNLPLQIELFLLSPLLLRDLPLVGQLTDLLLIRRLLRDRRPLLGDALLIGLLVSPLLQGPFIGGLSLNRLPLGANRGPRVNFENQTIRKQQYQRQD